MQTGTVQVHVYTSRANLPLEGATVIITQRDSQGRDILLSNQRTDESGNTAPVTIEAPPLSGSQQPGERQAFSYVDITADAQRYERVVIRDAQVFPGIVTLQAIQMLPLSGLTPEAGAAEEFVIPPQAL